MSELDLIVRLIIPAAAVALFAMAWPVIKSWDV
jgi:hypothetical protein